MKENVELVMQGVSLSKGIAMGSPYFPPVQKEEPIPAFAIAQGDVDQEITRYRNALFSSRKDLETLQDHLITKGSSEAITIIDTHIQMLEDPVMTTDVEEKIRTSNQNTEFAFTSVITEYKSRFSKNANALFLQRLADVTDLSQRVLGHLIPNRKPNLVEIPESPIVFSSEILPSDTAFAEAHSFLGIVTETGGMTSHAALIANAKGIPFVTGIDISQVKEFSPSWVIVDGFEGKLILNPDQETIDLYKKKVRKLIQQDRKLAKESLLSAQTKEGKEIPVFANIGSIADLDILEKQGSAGIGLLRTEYFLLQNRNLLHSEKLQYNLYHRCLEAANGSPVVIRVFDLGGDKFPDLVYQKEKESNPFLGCRGIRFLLQNQEILRTQFRAILRVAVHGEVRVLLPLISDKQEIVQTRKIWESVKKEMLLEERKIRGDIPIGSMIEVPSAALTADILAKESDFFSIGMNDLVQYTLAADRSNSTIDHLHDPFHPSLLRMIQTVVKEGKMQKIPISLCGEIAYKPIFVPLLLGLGITHFSCPPRYIPMIKKIVRKCSMEEAKKNAEQILQFSASEQIRDFLMKQYGKILPKDL